MTWDDSGHIDICHKEPSKKQGNPKHLDEVIMLELQEQTQSMGARLFVGRRGASQEQIGEDHARRQSVHANRYAGTLKF